MHDCGVEAWTEVPGLDGRYEISSHGRLRTRKRRLLKPLAVDRYGTLAYQITEQGHRTTRSAYQLFLRSWYPEYPRQYRPRQQRQGHLCLRSVSPP